VVRRGAERRRSRRSEIWLREWIKVVEGGSWTCGGAKKRHSEPEQLLSTDGATWRRSGVARAGTDSGEALRWWPSFLATRGVTLE
jgi:hypothetical protein